MKKQKKAWIRIVEAMIAILLIAGVVLIAIGQNQKLNPDTSEKVYTIESAILTQVQLNESARQEILNIQDSALPVNWSQFSSAVPNTQQIIIRDSPSSMQCIGRICATSDSCLLDQQSTPKQTVYSQEVIISANLNKYNPRMLKVFCWTS